MIPYGIFQFVVYGDEEVQHLVGEFVGLHPTLSEPLAAFEPPYGLAHHVGHRRAAAPALRLPAAALRGTPCGSNIRSSSARSLFLLPPAYTFIAWILAAACVACYGHHDECRCASRSIPAAMRL